MLRVPYWPDMRTFKPQEEEHFQLKHVECFKIH